MTSLPDFKYDSRTVVPIFDEIERTNAAPAGHGESTYTFLNRVSGEYWDQVRTLIQDWCAGISDAGEYEQIRKRFREADNYEFCSTFLEVYIHECLIRAGFSVTVHPDIPGTERHPDFYAERDDVRFYLEAISPTTSKDARGKAARATQLYDAINMVRSVDFYIWVTSLDVGERTAPGSKLRKRLEAWLSSLDPDPYADGTQWPVEHWELDDWKASFKAIPKSANKRGAHRQAIGVYPATVQRLDEAPKIVAAVKEKHKAYGDLGCPVVVAVGMYITDTAKFHASNALYGYLTDEITLSESGEVIDKRAVRNRTGYFGTPESWRNPQVSAVLVVNQLMPYHFQRADIALWKNPGARYGLKEELGLPWPEVIFSAGLKDVVEHPSPSEFFGIPDEWPIGSPWPV